ncbi:hypothetical protein [Salinarimonas sp. NSM]|uniref:hypothetical protein n=1 Tax=Salinarimonas sp. NSM TaxID=3458003 RepID=UPI004036CDFD
MRTAWANEAASFTPWLADNLDRLGDALGLELAIDATEVPVGPYRADIVARETREDTVVLIENQLDPSDHGHLGQILTYLTGLGAQRIVWIAPRFRDEHLSAVRWLNEHTIEPFAFFAVQVSVVRIGDSPLAPLFEVLEKPNDWDREVAVETRAARRDPEIGARRLAFWTYLVNRHPEMRADGAPDRASNRWRHVPEAGLVVSYFLAVDRVGVFVRGPRGADADAVTSRLVARQEAFEARIGAPLGARPEFAFSQRLRIDTTNEDSWPVMADWLRDEVARVAAAVVEIYGQD